MLRKKFVILLFSSFLFCNSSFSQFNLFGNKFKRDSIAVMSRVNSFLYAFANYKWTDFRSFFYDDATMFHPGQENDLRLTGKAEIDTAMMPEFIENAAEKPIDINPKDIRVQFYKKTGIVTFHLIDKDRMSRYSIIWTKRNGAWKITHMHASTFYANK
jgi:ketosteroid isomerase-like protein